MGKCNAEDICDSLAMRPQDWEATAYTLTNKTAGIVLWVANGITMEPYYSATPVYTTLLGRRKMRKAYKKWLLGFVHDKLWPEDSEEGEPG